MFLDVSNDGDLFENDSFPFALVALFLYFGAFLLCLCAEAIAACFLLIILVTFVETK